MSIAESDADFRIRELNDLFLREFDRRATDNAVKLLKQIAKETRATKSLPDVPTATPAGRLTFWREMYARARKNSTMDRVMQLLECMRADEVAA